MASDGITKKLSTLAMLGLVVAGLSATLGHASGEDREEQLKRRAEKIFDFEKRNGTLPDNRLIALSIALRFGDLKGAEAIAFGLEQRMKGI